MVICDICNEQEESITYITNQRASCICMLLKDKHICHKCFIKLKNRPNIHKVGFVTEWNRFYWGRVNLELFNSEFEALYKDTCEIQQKKYLDLIEREKVKKEELERQNAIKLKTCFCVERIKYEFEISPNYHWGDFYEIEFIPFLLKLFPKIKQKGNYFYISLCDLNFLYDALGFCGKNVCFEK